MANWPVLWYLCFQVVFKLFKWPKENMVIWCCHFCKIEEGLSQILIFNILGLCIILNLQSCDLVTYRSPHGVVGFRYVHHVVKVPAKAKNLLIFVKLSFPPRSFKNHLHWDEQKIEQSITRPESWKPSIFLFLRLQFYIFSTNVSKLKKKNGFLTFLHLHKYF